jgi:hypothetical protein
VDQFFYSLEREIRDAIPPSQRAETLLLITADHGQCDVPPEEALCLSEEPRLRDLLMLPPTGQSRASYFYANQGDAEALGEELARFEDRLLVRRSEDALQMGLFGPPEHAHRIRHRVGDYVGIGRGGCMVYGPEVHRDHLRLKGHHGSLTENEMLVPLIALPLDQW